MSQNHLTDIGGYLRREWRRVLLYAVGGVAAVFIIVQSFLIPWGAAPLYTHVDTVTIGGKTPEAAIKELEDSYARLPVEIYFGNRDKSYKQPATSSIGITMDAEGQIASVAYPWWLRLVPTSLWWAHTVTPTATSPAYAYDKSKLDSYMQSELGQSCDIKAANASLTYKDKKLQVVPAIDGGTCKLEDVRRVLLQAKPTLAKHDVRVPMVEHPAKVRDEQAQEVAKRLSEQTRDGVTIVANGQQVQAAQQDVLAWLDFAAPDSGVMATVNADRSKDFFDKQLLPKVAVTPGTSKVTTLDFTEISRQDGPSGRTLDSEATIKTLNSWLAGGKNTPFAQTKVVPPTVAYTRTYTPTDAGMQALVTQFAQGRPGSFGVSFAELDGKHRRAAYQDTKVFRTASTYKLYVAYGALKRVESGAWKWTDMVHGGRNLTKCLDDMIVKSDNPCGEAMLAKIGYRTMTNELSAIGLKKSSFVNTVPETTAGDLTAFVGALQAGQLLNPSSTSTLLSAMKRNIYRQGVPAGASGPVADKVGFLDGLFHDAAIVYSPSGTYALSIMTDGSNWAAIAELTREIEKLRAR